MPATINIKARSDINPVATCSSPLFGAVSAAGTDVLSEADSTAAGVDTEAWKKLSRVGRLVKFI